MSDNEQTTLLAPEKVRAMIEAQRQDGELWTMAVNRFAADLGISQRAMFGYLRDGVKVKTPKAAKKLIEYLEKQK